MHKKLSKTPITYVLAQVNFTNVEAIEKFIPDLQESIRQSFPNFKKLIVQSDQFQWHFIDKASVTGIFLNSASITIHTSKYTQFEVFLRQFRDVLEEFSKILNISLLSRIGLRYINLIQGDLNQYVHSGFLGFHLEDDKYFEPNRFLINTRLTEESKCGIIQIQSALVSDKGVINSTNLFVNSELAGVASHLSFSHRQEPSGKFLILDLDHFRSNFIAETFEVNTVIDQLKNLQEVLYQAFCAAITEKALTDWQ